MSDQIPAKKNNVVPAQVPEALAGEWQKYNEMADPSTGLVTVTNPSPEEAAMIESLFGTQAVQIVEEKPADIATGSPKTVTIQVQHDEGETSPTERAAARRQTFAA
jgi:hypothetical protein